MVCIIALLIILAVSIGITVWALFYRNAGTKIMPDYATFDEEENAVPFEETDTEKMEQEPGGGAVSLTYSKDVTVNLSEETVSLMFANPQKSNQNMVLQVMIHDTVIAQSGLLTPGKQIRRLDLLNTVQLYTGQYDGKIVVYYYQPDSGEMAMLKTDIPLTITVEE